MCKQFLSSWVRALITLCKGLCPSLLRLQPKILAAGASCERPGLRETGRGKKDQNRSRGSVHASSAPEEGLNLCGLLRDPQSVPSVNTSPKNGVEEGGEPCATSERGREGGAPR